MKKNVGFKDQLVRFAMAFLTVLLFLSNCISGTLTMLLLALLAITALFRFCPFYFLFKFSTKKESESKI